MPVQTRCPSCAAAIPANAAWCSLCHADLRPKSVVTAASTVVPGRALRRASAGTPVPQAATSSAAVDLADAPDWGADAVADVDDAPRGRHARHEPDDDPEPAPSGRHAAGSRAASRSTSRPEPRSTARSGGRRSRSSGVDLVDELVVPDDATPEEVEAVADRMLDRLAIATPRPHLLDPGDLPGGKWGVAAAGTLAVILVLLVLYTILGFIVGR